MSARRFVLLSRIALLAVAAAAVGASAIAWIVRERGSAHAGVRFVCPMHPEVASDEAGTCPICRMELETTWSAMEGASAALIKSSTYHRYDSLRKRFYGPDTPAPAYVDGDGAIVVVLYQDELPASSAGVRATFVSALAPQAPPAAIRASNEPPEPWDLSTCRVRFRVEGADSGPRPGDVGWVRLVGRPPSVPQLPRTAILQGEDGARVLVASADGRTLTARPVRIGRTFGGVTAVTSGVSDAERVLSGSAFFVDAELRLRHAQSIEIAP